ncbi:21435_t:CDS:2, partial [Racocetra persica]
MSFDIFWEKLDKDLANKVQDLLNEYFRNSNNKPSFIGDIEISDFSFGTIPPSIEIVNVTDPFLEFYLPDNANIDVECKFADDNYEHLPIEFPNNPSIASIDNNSTHLADDTSVNSSYLDDNSIQSDELTDEPEVPLKQDTDVQLHVNMNYKGNMRMTITTELHMNYPSMMFMSLPIRLTVTGFEFSATAVIASLRQRVNFCFLAPKDPEE